MANRKLIRKGETGLKTTWHQYPGMQAPVDDLHDGFLSFKDAEKYGYTFVPITNDPNSQDARVSITKDGQEIGKGWYPGYYDKYERPLSEAAITPTEGEVWYDSKGKIHINGRPIEDTIQETTGSQRGTLLGDLRYAWSNIKNGNGARDYGRYLAAGLLAAPMAIEAAGTTALGAPAESFSESMAGTLLSNATPTEGGLVASNIAAPQLAELEAGKVVSGAVTGAVSGTVNGVSSEIQKHGMDIGNYDYSNIRSSMGRGVLNGITNKTTAGNIYNNTAWAANQYLGTHIPTIGQAVQNVGNFIFGGN